jgi:hypothetical protein
MGRTCGKWGRIEMHVGFRWGNLRAVNLLEDPGVDRRIILKQIFDKWDGRMDGIDVTPDRYR